LQFETRNPLQNCDFTFQPGYRLVMAMAVQQGASAQIGERQIRRLARQELIE
jgi:hypothetical protein